jgi:hypothetical protein
MHHFIVGVLTIFALISILFSELGDHHNKIFRNYSKISIALIFIFAIVTVIAGLSQNTFKGFFERITIVFFMQWVMAISIIELKHSINEKASERIKYFLKANFHRMKRSYERIF